MAVDHVGSIMTAGGNLAWSAANIGGPGKLFLSHGCWLCALESGSHCGWALCVTRRQSNIWQARLAGSASLEEIDRMVKLEGAGSGGLLYLPYLNGTLSLIPLRPTSCFGNWFGNKTFCHLVLEFLFKLGLTSGVIKCRREVPIWGWERSWMLSRHFNSNHSFTYVSSCEWALPSCGFLAVCHL